MGVGGHSEPTKPDVEGVTQSGVMAVPERPTRPAHGESSPSPRIPTPLEAFPALLEASVLAELAKGPSVMLHETREPPSASPVPPARERPAANASRPTREPTVTNERRQAPKRSSLLGHALLAIGGTLLGAGIVLAYAFARGLLRWP